MNSNQPSKKMEEVDNKNHEVDDTYALPVNHHSQTVSKLSCKEKICHVIKNVTVEPTIILSTVAAAMQELLIQDLVTDQTCLVTYGNSEEFCANVTNVAFSAELNKQTTTYNYYRTTLETIPSIFIALFFGPWSDKYGTKLLVFIPIIGDILSGVFYTVLSYIRYVRPQYLLLGSVIQGLHGGNLTFNLGVCCFIIRESSILSRTTRIAFTDVAFFIGIPFGRQLGVLIRSQYGAEAVFGVAIQFNIIALCYAFWRLRGTQNMNIQDISKVKAFQEMFKLENLKNCLAVMFKKRAGKKRIHVILIMLCAQLIVFPRKGEREIFYQFTRRTLHFTMKEFSLYETLSYGNLFVGNVIILPILSLYFRVKDITLIIVAVIASIANDLLIGFSSSALMLYIAAMFGFFNTSASIISRSLLTKCVDRDELGKLLAVFMLIAIGMPSLSSLVYTQVFNATLITFPPMCFVMSAALTLIPALCLIWVSVDLYQTPQTSPQEIQMNCPN